MNTLKVFTALLLGVLSTVVTICMGVVCVPFIAIFLICCYTKGIYNALTAKKVDEIPTIKDVFKEAVEKISQSKKSEK